MRINVSFVPAFILKLSRSALHYTQSQMTKALELELPHYKAIEMGRCPFPRYAIDRLNALLEPLEAANLRVSYTNVFFKQVRGQMGLSMRKMAALIGVAVSSYWAWESGKSTPRNKKYLLRKLISVDCSVIDKKM